VCFAQIPHLRRLHTLTGIRIYREPRSAYGNFLLPRKYASLKQQNRVLLVHVEREIGLKAGSTVK
jgi:hypothetical protein